MHHTVCPPVFLNIEGSCVSYCREWKMPFTIWYGRSGCTGSISSARKKRLRAVSSLKSVLWCERGKCMQPGAHELCVDVCVCWWGFWRRQCERTHSESWCSKLTCWFLLGLWWSCDSRLNTGWFPLFNVSVYHCWSKYTFTLGLLTWVWASLMPPLPLYANHASLLSHFLLWFCSGCTYPNKCFSSGTKPGFHKEQLRMLSKRAVSGKLHCKAIQPI